jgi:hypothetical protein
VYRQLDDLAERIEALRHQARPMVDLDGKPIRVTDRRQTDQHVHDYSFIRGNALETLRDWLADAHRELLTASRHGDAGRLDRALIEFCGMSLTRARDISLGDFAPPEPMDDDPEYFDPVLAREGFHLLVCWLCHESRAWAQYEPRQSGEIRLSETVIFWTPERLAASMSPPIQPISITKKINKFRNENGRDPLWVQRPDGESGYLIDMVRYLQLEGDPRIDWTPGR